MARPRKAGDRAGAGKAEHTAFELPTVSQPFEAGAHGRVAIKIVDDRSIESLK